MAASAPQSQSLPLSAEEEALKRNTDCVYFLASPLTCKKGNECEYRHSEIARVNPRDCYFWPQGNCLNPKCGFRHPPLEGLLATQVPTSTGPSAPTHVSNAALAKPGVPPCVFFQKGYCMKGDWCPFLHGPNSINPKPAPMPATVPPSAEPAANKNASIGFKKPMQEKKISPVNVAIKPAFAVDTAPPRNEFTVNKRQHQTDPVSNGGDLVNWPIRTQQYRHLDEPELENMNIRDGEEFSREPSPGFDVLVDDDVRDTDYYPTEDRYGMASEQDISLSTDYFSMTDNDEKFQGPIGYDLHEPRKGQYEGPYFERRPYSSQADGLDLRHRLSKQKKPNGLRSVISDDMRVGDRRNYMEEKHKSSRENSLSSRLRGRISLPVRSQSPNNKFRDRLSPVRVRAHDRTRGKVEEGFNNNNNYNGGRSYRGPHSRREEGGFGFGFSGPKSLAELKNRKNGEEDSSNQQQSVGKRKLAHIETRNGFPFEGPKPLEEILKRKRGERIQNSSKIIEEGKDLEMVKNDGVDDSNHGHNHDNNSKQEDEDLVCGDDQEGDEAYDQQRDGEDFDPYDGENGEADEDDDDDDFAKKMGVMYS